MNKQTSSEILAIHSKAYADPLRLNILKVLGEGSFGVLELCQLFDVKQPSMSHHLKILATSRLASTHREGNTIFYQRALLNPEDDWFQLTTELFSAVDNLLLPETAAIRLQELYQVRANSAQEFFNKHAAEFKEQQDLIASYEQYGETLESLLDQIPTAKTQAMEIGPGEGAFLLPLASAFDQVIGLDVSQAMLDKAKQLLEVHDVNNVQLAQGTTELAKQENITADFISCNMVLHHVPAPKEIFNDVAKLLTPNTNSRFLITDLCRHDQEWAKNSCGDLWLGFEPEELTRWAEQAGLIEDQSQYLGLRNGFQIQFRIFKLAE